MTAGNGTDELHHRPRKTRRLLLTILLVVFSLLGGLMLGVFTAGRSLAYDRYVREAVYWQQLGYEDGYQQAMQSGLEQMLVLAKNGELNESNLQDIWR